MKVIKLFIFIALFIFGAELYAEVLLGLQNDSLIEVKPKTCDFQWWKGSKNYDTSGTDKKAEDQNGITKK